MEYATRIDGSPNTVLTAMMFKVTSRIFKEREGTFISGKVADDYRNDIGANESYRDFIRFIHVKYEWSMKDESIKRLNMRARGALILQSQPKLSYEWYKKLRQNHKRVDEQPNLKAKKEVCRQAQNLQPPQGHLCGQLCGTGRLGWGGQAYQGLLYHHGRRSDDRAQRLEGQLLPELRASRQGSQASGALL